MVAVFSPQFVYRNLSSVLNRSDTRAVLAEIRRKVHSIHFSAVAPCNEVRTVTENRPFVFVVFTMAKKQKSNPEGQLLALLKDVLPKAVADQKLVDKI